MKLNPGVQVVATDVSPIVRPGVTFNDERMTITYPVCNYAEKTIRIHTETIEQPEEYFRRKLKGK